MFILKFIMLCIVNSIIRDVLDTIIVKFIIPENEKRFNRTRNFLPDMVSYILIAYLLFKDFSLKTILLGIITIKLINFIGEILNYKYILINGNELYFKTEKIKLNFLVLDFSYKINPKFFFMNKVDYKNTDISNITINAIFKNKLYTFYDNDIIKGFEVLNELHKDYKIQYVYNAVIFDNIKDMLTELSKNTKKEIDYYLNKFNDCDEFMILEVYRNRILDICKSLNINEEEINEIIQYIK